MYYMVPLLKQLRVEYSLTLVQKVLQIVGIIFLVTMKYPGAGYIIVFDWVDNLYGITCWFSSFN